MTYPVDSVFVGRRFYPSHYSAPSGMGMDPRPSSFLLYLLFYLD